MTGLVVRRPVGRLASIVECFWFFRGSRPSREIRLPSASPGIVIALDDVPLRICESAGASHGDAYGVAAVCGPYSRHFVVDQTLASSMVGVQFRPGAAAGMLGVPLDRMANRHETLIDLWGSEGRVIRDQVLDASTPGGVISSFEKALLERAERTTPVHPAVSAALRQFARAPRVARIRDISRASGYSARGFIRLFTASVGMTPKRYSRIVRLHAAVQSLAQGRRVEWSAFALDAGYCDQSHFIRDFHEMTGLTPGEYQPVSPDAPNHASVRDR